MESHTTKRDVETKGDALPRPEDYSFHLIAARKALATAEAQAALHLWVDAQLSLCKVTREILDAQRSMQTTKIGEYAKAAVAGAVRRANV